MMNARGQADRMDSLLFTGLYIMIMLLVFVKNF